MNKKENIVKSALKDVLTESSLSRIWGFIESPTGTFGVVSANRAEYSQEIRVAKHLELIKAVRGMNLGFIKLRGGYKEETGGYVEEDSLFIPNISKEQIINLGVHFLQDSVIFKDPLEFVLIGTNQETGVGHVILTFKKSSGAENLVLNSSEFQSAFSQLVKGNHKDRKFLFNLNENEFSLKASFGSSFNQVAYQKKESDNWIKLF